MEFTCLWSKDAQQKKRKRWTDGIARFSSATGVLSVWDQDASVKVSSARLKPNEAEEMLQEDGEETRVGGVSLQIMADISHKQEQGHQQRRTNLTDDTAETSPRRDPLATVVGVSDAVDASRGFSGFKESPASARATAKQGASPSTPLGSSTAVAVPDSLATGKPASRLGAASGSRRGKLGVSRSLPSAPLAGPRSSAAGLTSGSFGREETPAVDDLGKTASGVGIGGCGGGGLGPGLRRRVLKPLVSRLAPQAENGLTDKPDLFPPPFAAAAHLSAKNAAKDSSPGSASQTGGSASSVTRKRAGLGGSGSGGVGGARRFHAPRSSGAAATTAGTGADATRPGLASAALSADASRQQVDQRGGGRGALPNRYSVSRASCIGGVSRVAAAAPAESVDVVVNPEDLVLEWTAGNPPKPLRAGASLARRLHPHQREGLKMLWECLAGRGGYQGRGAILADEMGLGKTATAIALCTCVLRYRRAECRKAVVVCPSSLVKNWANEFRKWCPLGGGAVAVDQAGAAAAQLVADFKMGAPARYPILVISYELYRNHGKIINATEGLGLLIADEGHRLKNSAETKTTRALKACPAVMRLVLTGTPMQNDLDEFFAVADFVNPGLLGTLKSFRSRYTRPIKAAWDREADEDVGELATERTRELGEMTGKFVLRRTKDVIRGSLPPALEVVVFCRPSPHQLSLYERCISSSSARALLFDEGGPEGGAGGRPVGFQGVLPLISTLRRLCNHPDLVAGGSGSGSGSRYKSASQESDYPFEEGAAEDDDDEDLAFLILDNVKKVQPPELQDKENDLATGGGGDRIPTSSWKVPRSSDGAATATAKAQAGRTSGATVVEGAVEALQYEAEASGKVLVLELLLKAVRRDFPGDKVVVSSNFTSALDVLGRLADLNAWGFLRLDGGTASNLRQSLVDRFNRAPPEDLFLFFLSAKAGGVGLNLVGANRIVLFDSDWNPATDDQAMARVWRLGQTKEVSMYRLLSTGTLEESIYQRQIFKGALYDLIHDSNEPDSAPSKDKSTASRSGDAKGQQRRRASRESQGHGAGGNNRKRGRGFSQEELKELFVLKTETRSDTYDKLRRGRATVTLQEEPPFQPENDGCSGTWNDYLGPSSVLDDALRRALEGNGIADDGGSSGSPSTSTASRVVTFVREVKRGGPPARQEETFAGCNPSTALQGTAEISVGENAVEGRLVSNSGEEATAIDAHHATRFSDSVWDEMDCGGESLLLEENRPGMSAPDTISEVGGGKGNPCTKEQGSDGNSEPSTRRRRVFSEESDSNSSDEA